MENKRERLVKLVTPVGAAYYPHLAEPDDYKGVLSYKTGLILDPSDDGVAEFMEKVEAACRKALDEGLADLQSKIDEGELKGKALKDAKDHVESMALKLPWDEEYDDGGEETGRIIIKTKAKAEGTYASGKNKGKAWKRDLPIFDAAKQAVEKDGLRLWGGSKIKLQVELQPYFMPATGMSGVSLRIYAVQIIELSSGGGDAADGFGVEDGYVGEKKSAPAENHDDTEADAEEDEDF